MELTVDRVSKQYGSKIAVDRISLKLQAGIYGLLGENGAGKTTLMRLLCGILKPTSGSITLDGMDVSREEYRAELGYLPQDFGYYPDFTGTEFLLYMAALKDPDSLADIPDHENCRFMALPYVGDMAYERLRGRMPHVDMDPDAHRRLTAELKKGIVYGAETGYPHEWSEIAAYLPRLTARHTTPEELRARGRRGRLWNHGDPDIQKARAAAPKKKKARSGKQKGGESR